MKINPIEAEVVVSDKVPLKEGKHAIKQMLARELAEKIIKAKYSSLITTVEFGGDNTFFGKTKYKVSFWVFSHEELQELLREAQEKGKEEGREAAQYDMMKKGDAGCLKQEFYTYSISKRVYIFLRQTMGFEAAIKQALSAQMCAEDFARINWYKTIVPTRDEFYSNGFLFIPVKVAFNLMQTFETGPSNEPSKS